MNSREVSIEPARPDQREQAFRLVFRHLPDAERDKRVANALWLMDRGELPAESLLAASQGGRVVGALVCLPVAGAGALVWPPGATDEGADGYQRAVEDSLAKHATSWLRSRGVKLAQTLLTSDEQRLAEPLVRNGFRHVTRLCYLRHDLEPPLPRRRVGARLESLAELGDDRLFQETLVRTYEGTRDCPELNGVRSAEAVLEGHRAQGNYDSAGWWLAWGEGRPAGVLILTDQPDLGAWEVSYMGVVPEARRHGLGRDLMAHALQCAAGEGAPQMTLSVDARNIPAWNLYLDLGFRPHDQREVYLALWP